MADLEKFASAVEYAHEDYSLYIHERSLDGIVRLAEAGTLATKWTVMVTDTATVGNGLAYTSLGARHIVSVITPSSWTGCYPMQFDSGYLHSLYVHEKLPCHADLHGYYDRPGEIYAMTRLIATALNRRWFIDGLPMSHPINLFGSTEVPDGQG